MISGRASVVPACGAKPQVQDDLAERIDGGPEPQERRPTIPSTAGHAEYASRTEAEPSGRSGEHRVSELYVHTRQKLLYFFPLTCWKLVA